MTKETQKDHTRLALEQATVKISTTSGFKGTGFFINPDGYILTAWHCIAEVIPMPFSIITVETIEGQTFTAQLAQDKSIQASDIAVLKIDYTTEHCVPLGLITEKNRGDGVIAIGYPAAYIEGRGIGVYAGIINQLLKPEKTAIDEFETTAIEGQGQSGGLIYHFETQRLIGLAKKIYLNEVTKTTGVAVRFESLFAKWPDLERINKQVAHAWDERMALVPKPLDAAQLLRLLNQVPDIKGKLPKIKRHGWPLPVQTALQDLKKPLHHYVQDYINLFEAFIHLHFVTLASQFYWASRQTSSDKPADAIKAGFSVLCEVLSHSVRGGGENWLRRSALLSSACQQYSAGLPFPELPGILEDLVIEKRPNTEKENQATDFWCIKQGGERWNFLQALTVLRAELAGYELLELNTLADETIMQKLFAIQDSLGDIFQAYHDLQLAIISETIVDTSQQPQVGIHCYWQDGDFLCVSNPNDRRDMEEIWEPDTTPGKQDLLKAPKPPDSKWHWDESLLLYNPQNPHANYVYLMPLGSRYRPQTTANYLPGLLDSVVRKENQEISGVIQRSYQDGFQWQADDDDIVAIQTVNECIKQLVKSLCEGFAYELPVTDLPLVDIPPQFDLHYERLAAQLTANVIERPQERERVLSLLTNTATQRLLLEGASGSGKSVLLAQIFRAEPYAVFIGLDIKPEPLAESAEAKASVALRVGMYCLTVLNRLMQRQPVKGILPLPKIKATIRDNLSFFAKQYPHKHFLIIVDGLNQIPDPGGLLGALPDDLPSNLYILASSQAQQRVRQPLTQYGHQAWQITDMAQLARDEAEAIVWHYWGQASDKLPTPQRADFPESLLESLYQASHGLPIFLADWTQRLRGLWADDPQHFSQQAEAHFHHHHATALPKFLEDRLAIAKREAKDKFKPLALLDALLWCLSLIQKSITVNELQGAIQALRQQKLFADLPAVSNQQIEDGLSWLGGFVRSLAVGFEKRWQLQHEILGQWFCEQHGRVESLPKLRLSLVKFGAVPLPEKASEAEFGQWLEWVRAEDYEHYHSLVPELQVSVLDSLLAHLPEKSSDRALVLANLVWVFLSGTGEQQRGFALESVLEKALHSHLPIATQVEVLVSLGNIQQRLNKLDNALEYYKRSFALSEQQLSESNTSQNCREVRNAFGRIGDVYVSQNQLDKALEYFERAFTLSEQLLSESATPQNRRDVSIALNHIGNIYVSQNQFDKALEYFERSLSLHEQLTKESATPQNRRDVSIVLIRIGDVYVSQNQFDKALEYFERSLALCEQLLSESEYFERSLSLHEQLTKESATPQNRRDVSIVLERIGDVYVSQNQFDKALEYFERSLSLSEQLTKESATPQNRRDVSIVLIRIGDVYVSQNQFDKALEYFERSLALCEQLLSESATPQNRDDVGTVLNRLGNLHSSQNEFDKALEYFNRSLELSEQLLAESETPTNRRGVSIALICIGDVHYYGNNQPDKALEYYERSHSFLKQLLEESPIPRAVEDMQAISDRLEAVRGELSEPDCTD
jgi:tetratricopeptide (TPR) repeat protein